MKIFIIFLSSIVLFTSCSEHPHADSNTIARGQMPCVTVDSSHKVHVVYGSGDSIMYTFSNDEGTSFSAPVVAAVIPHLAASHSRGPQIAATANGLSVTACNNDGDIFSFYRDGPGAWAKGARVNDVDTVAKEGLMSLSADGNNSMAVWLDLRSGNNQIYGAASADGGRTWLANKLIYSSPDTTVCECCKPSVLVSGNTVSVMFRNWINGNRDMYLIQSENGGNSFGPAQKLGNGSWSLNGCPVDGGGIATNGQQLQTVWRRQDKIYACIPTQPEKEIGQGKSCVITSVNGQNVYAWVENGNVVCLLPNGNKQTLGTGKLPVIKAINEQKAVCIWENEKQVQHAIVQL